MVSIYQSQGEGRGRAAAASGRFMQPEEIGRILPASKIFCLVRCMPLHAWVMPDRFMQLRAAARSVRHVLPQSGTAVQTCRGCSRPPSFNLISISTTPCQIQTNMAGLFDSLKSKLSGEQVDAAAAKAKQEVGEVCPRTQPNPSISQWCEKGCITTSSLADPSSCTW
jgi:hypothetical protein